MSDSAADKGAIERVKYRYLRALDTKDWEAFADTLTENVTGDYGGRLHFATSSSTTCAHRSARG